MDKISDVFSIVLIRQFLYYVLLVNHSPMIRHHLTIGVSFLSINLQTIYKVISQKDNAKQMSITKSQFQ